MTGAEFIDAVLTGQARQLPPSTVDRLGRQIVARLDPERAERRFDADAYERRMCSIGTDFAGMGVYRLFVDQATHVQLRALIARWAAPRPAGEAVDEDGAVVSVKDVRTPGQRQADAMIDLLLTGGAARPLAREDTDPDDEQTQTEPEPDPDPSTTDTGPGPDTGPGSGPDAGPGPDTGTGSGPDAEPAAGPDTSPDSPGTGPAPEPDAGPGAGPDAGPGAGPDAGPDPGPPPPDPDRDGPPPDRDGPAADAPAPDRGGPPPDRDGPAADAPAPDRGGPAPDGGGRAPDGGGRAPDGGGRAADGGGRAADGGGRAPDRGSRPVDDGRYGGVFPASPVVSAEITIIATIDQLAAAFGATDPAATSAGPARMTLAGTIEDFPGATLHPQVLARLACDSPLRRILTDHRNVPLHHGRARRLATTAQKRALAVRDGGCVIPGCPTPPEWTEAHHLTPWDHGGRTDLDAMVLLCPRHHTAHHAGIYDIRHHNGTTWVRPPAWQHPARPWLTNTTTTHNHLTDHITHTLNPPPRNDPTDHAA